MPGTYFKIAQFLGIISLLMLFCSSHSFGQASLAITEPHDKLITYEPVIKISGKASEIDKLVINGISIDLNRYGEFLAGLKLHPGKNFVEISATPMKGKKINKTIRILRLVTFPDMDMLYEGKKHWGRRATIDLSTAGIIEGYPDGYFYPSVWISRGELATWLCRTMGLARNVPTRDVFYDVPKEHWRAPFIKAVTDARYMKAFSKNLFGINDA
ncbi:MAG: S-layer homology domain-containing protein, partial [Candidatus Saganbacteria bacterium]|nr:S-layer homology domain-containing protein [Candidatus Saganbacteria bacterium]